MVGGEGTIVVKEAEDGGGGSWVVAKWFKLRYRPFDMYVELGTEHTRKNVSILCSCRNSTLVLLRGIGRDCRHEANSGWIRGRMCEVSKIEGHQIAEKIDLV